MTIKEAVEIAIKSKMETFIITSNDYYGMYHIQTIDTVYDFIQGYENEEVIALYLGSCYSKLDLETNKTIYTDPSLCEIVYKTNF